MSFFDKFSTDIGIDLGTCNTLIYVRDKGMVIDEPSVIAVEKGTSRIVAVGSDAKRMLDETGCTAIMIGRAAIGNPWIILDGCRHFLLILHCIYVLVI